MANLKEILPQLSNWCKVNNVSVQSIYDDSHGLTLQELVYYLFGVVKQSSAEVVEYEEKFSELKTFVDDYFNNLDVQEEINKKLEIMATDGSLSELIAPFINSTSTPIPVSSTSAMNEHDKIYVLTTDMHLYYYNGSEFVDSGVVYGSENMSFTTMSGTYNSSNLPDLNNAVANRMYIITNLSGILNIPADLNDGETHSGNLLVFSLSNAPRFGELQIYITRRPSKIYLRLYYNSWTEWVTFDDRKTSFYSAETTYTQINANDINQSGVYVYSSVGDDTSTPGTYGGFLICFTDNTYDFTLQMFINSAGYSYYRTLWGSPKEWSAWVRFGGLSFMANIGFSSAGDITDFNDLEFNSFYSISSPSNILNSPGNTLGGVCFTYSNSQVIGLGATQIFIETAVSKTPRMFMRTYWGVSASWSDWRKINNTDFTDNIFCAFNNFGVIGDSLACGTVAYHDGGTVKFTQIESVSWGHYLSKRNGMEYENFSISGATVKEWLASSEHETCMTSGHEKNCYLIGLQVNDGTQGTTIGNLSDIKQNSEDNSDTYYGNYGKILQELNTFNNKAKIFCFGTPHNYEEYNEAVKNICENCEFVSNAYYIDLSEYQYNYYNSAYPVINDSIRGAGHFNAIAYCQMADIIKKAISDYMCDNVNEFLQIEFIGTDYSW